MVPEDPSLGPGLREAWQKLLIPTPLDWPERGREHKRSLVQGTQIAGRRILPYTKSLPEGPPLGKSLPNLGPFVFEYVEGVAI